MPKSTSPKPVEHLTYEAALAELENIVAALENEQSSLDESMSLYERGQALLRRCTELLDQAELKVTQLSGSDLADLKED